MRLIRTFSVIVIFILGGIYLYQAASVACFIPVSYTLGTIDPSFNLTQPEAEMALAAAANIWEEALEQDLFIASDQADVTVSFLFDERQANANEQTLAARQLDDLAEKDAVLRAVVEELRVQYDSMSDDFTTRLADYDISVKNYNETVRQLNDRGGANPTESAELREIEQSLQLELVSLQSLGQELNEISSKLNQISSEGNRLIQTYNQSVDRFNNKFGTGEEITQGEYLSSGEINVYKFSSEAELVSVLAHEFGHALGVTHVEEPGSLMYYLLEEGIENTLSLTSADIDAYHTQCQPDTWSFKLRQFIRNYLV